MRTCAQATTWQTEANKLAEVSLFIQGLAPIRCPKTGKIVGIHNSIILGDDREYIGLSSPVKESPTYANFELAIANGAVAEHVRSVTTANFTADTHFDDGGSNNTMKFSDREGPGRGAPWRRRPRWR